MAPLAERKDTISQVLTSWSLLGVFSYTERASILNHHKSFVFPFHNLFVSFLLLLPLLLLITKCNQKLQKYRDLILTCFLFTLFTRGYGRICNWIGAFLLHCISVNSPLLLYCVYYYSTRNSWLNHYPIPLIYPQNEEQIISPYQITILIGQHPLLWQIVIGMDLSRPPPAGLYGLWRRENIIQSMADWTC